MVEQPDAPPVIRDLKPSDLPRIIEIDIEVLGKPRPEYWEMKVELARSRPEVSFLVAEKDGRVIGFIIGGASRWEYGVPEDIGWIDTIGVDPEHQRQGAAGALFKEMSRNLKRAGVKSIYTFVTRRDWKMLKFFNSLGFQRGDMVNLELDL